MRNASVVRETVDGMRLVAVLHGEVVTIHTDLAGPLTEVATGRWDGTCFECAAWLGRDQVHSDMVFATIADGLAADERRRPRDHTMPGVS
jgi:hypothetical protein